jgi:methylenetetrahydrofolate dehydrogenase (NADP+)/methenyltetrahydrofolate cyclohydrolase
MTEAQILFGKPIADKVKAEVRESVGALLARGIAPGLAVILVGDDRASQIYVRNKGRACQEVGIAVFDHVLPGTTTQQELVALVESLNADPKVHGVLLQLPLPAPLDAENILRALDPTKDVDGLCEENIGRLWLGRPRFVPCTPLGVMRLLSEANIPLRGSLAVIVGRSMLVGKPMAALLLAADATVTLCHTKTAELSKHIASADLVVTAIGKPRAIPGDAIKPGATVIDVGINRLETGEIVGDIEFSAAKERASAITPVPGGVGLLTVAMLLQNTVLAAHLAHNLLPGHTKPFTHRGSP